MSKLIGPEANKSERLSSGPGGNSCEKEKSCSLVYYPATHVSISGQTHCVCLRSFFFIVIIGGDVVSISPVVFLFFLKSWSHLEKIGIYV